MNINIAVYARTEKNEFLLAFTNDERTLVSNLIAELECFFQEEYGYITQLMLNTQELTDERIEVIRDLLINDINQAYDELNGVEKDE